MSAHRLVLASASPRRAELLRLLGMRHIVRPVAIDETDARFERGSPAERVCNLARSKARTFTEWLPGDTVIGCDTLVFLDGRPLGKPDNRNQAAHFLRRLSGRNHYVLSGVALIKYADCGACYQEVYDSDCTRVRMRHLDGTDIESYLHTGEYRDKAGAYAIQGIGARLVYSIDGDYSNVVGFPCGLFLRLLNHLESHPGEVSKKNNDSLLTHDE